MNSTEPIDRRDTGRNRRRHRRSPEPAASDHDSVLGGGHHPPDQPTNVEAAGRQAARASPAGVPARATPDGWRARDRLPSREALKPDEPILENDCPGREIEPTS